MPPCRAVRATGVFSTSLATTKPLIPICNCSSRRFSGLRCSLYHYDASALIKPLGSKPLCVQCCRSCRPDVPTRVCWTRSVWGRLARPWSRRILPVLEGAEALYPGAVVRDAAGDRRHSPWRRRRSGVRILTSSLRRYGVSATTPLCQGPPPGSIMPRLGRVGKEIVDRNPESSVIPLCPPTSTEGKCSFQKSNVAMTDVLFLDAALYSGHDDLPSPSARCRRAGSDFLRSPQAALCGW